MNTKTKEIIVDSKKSKKINYKKSDFKKGLDEIEEIINETKSFKSVDATKLHYSFSI